VVVTSYKKTPVSQIKDRKSIMPILRLFVKQSMEKTLFCPVAGFVVDNCQILQNYTLKQYYARACLIRFYVLGHRLTFFPI
jgi:hypothetical protein